MRWWFRKKRHPAFNDVDEAQAIVYRSARVSKLAAVGLPGEHLAERSQHPAIVMQGATVREFARVQAGTHTPTIVAPNALLMAGSHVGHDAYVGRDARLCPNAVVCGHARIGQRAIIYSGAVVQPFVQVGAGAIVAANSCVTKDVPANQVWGGSPARYIRERES